MTTGTPGNQARNQARQTVNTWRQSIAWNDPSNGANVNRIVLPQGAFITGVYCEVINAFDGTATLLLGSGATPNNLIAAADVNLTLANRVTEVTRGYGRSVTAAGDTQIASRLTSTNGTVGSAELVMTYEGNNG